MSGAIPVAATMRAAVLCGIGRIEVRDVAVPEIGPNDVLLRIQAVGLCGTDLHLFGGHINFNRDSTGRIVPLEEKPQILGHEIAAVVAEVGSGVQDLVPGDQVIVDQGRTCVGEGYPSLCEYCESGDSHQCEHFAEHGITGPPGGMAEYMAIPAVNAIRVESELPPEVAALVEPLGCVVHAADLILGAASRYRLRPRDGERAVRSILVCGTGPAGLLFIQYLRNVLGFEGTLLATEPNPTKRELAHRFGADTIDPAAENAVEAVTEKTGGRKVELLIEATGSASVFTAIPLLMRKQATALLYGHGHTGVDIRAVNQVQYLEPTLISPIGASGGFDPDQRPVTYRRALRLVESGAIEIASMITHRYTSLDAVQGALLSDHLSPDYVKGVVVL